LLIITASIPPWGYCASLSACGKLLSSVVGLSAIFLSPFSNSRPVVLHKRHILRIRYCLLMFVFIKGLQMSHVHCFLCGRPVGLFRTRINKWGAERILHSALVSDCVQQFEAATGPSVAGTPMVILTTRPYPSYVLGKTVL